MTKNKKNELEKTVKRESGRLFNFIKNNIPGLEDAEDILQDVLYQLVAGYEDIVMADQVSSWLFRVAKNKIIDKYRKRKTEPISVLKGRGNTGEDDEPLMLEEFLPSPDEAPDEQYMNSLIWDEIQRALDELPPEQREVFIMHEFDDLSFNEIADITNKPVNTLLSRKRYAVQFLRKRLQKLYKENFQ